MSYFRESVGGYRFILVMGDKILEDDIKVLICLIWEWAGRSRLCFSVFSCI